MVEGRRGYYRFGFDYGFHKKLDNGEEAWRLRMVIPQNKYVVYINNHCAMSIKVEGSAEIRMHGEREDLLFQKDDEAVNAMHTSSTIGSYKDVIGVGIMCYRRNYINIYGKQSSNGSTVYPEGRISSWSSAGPRFDGLMKPDVSAPGYNIFAAQNSFVTGKEKTRSEKYTYEQFMDGGRQYEIIGISGTSMAAPVVTGIVALWLQADPTLTPDRIKEVIAATAKHPDPNLTYPNNVYGHGDIDAYAGLLKILEATSGIPTLSMKQADVTFSGRTLHIQGANVASVTVYSLTGQVVMQTTTTDGTVQLPQLPSAVYAVQVNAEGRSLGSTLIRL